MEKREKPLILETNATNRSLLYGGMVTRSLLGWGYLGLEFLISDHGNPSPGVARKEWYHCLDGSCP